MLTQVTSVALAGCLAIAGCQNAEERARYVKEPLETVDAASLSSVNQAVREARTRLLTVRNQELRAELSKDIDDEYQRMLLQIRETERREKEQAAVQEEKERAAREAEERQAAMQARKEREAEEKERAARQLEERQAEIQAQKEREAEKKELRRSAAKTEQDRGKQAVADLQVGTRPSLLGDGTQVLVLRNPKPFPVQFNLRCYTRGDTAKKDFGVTVPAFGETHIGFLQGWCGNFKPGERCEGYYDGERLWNRKIPNR